MPQPPSCRHDCRDRAASSATALPPPPLAAGTASTHRASTQQRSGTRAGAHTAAPPHCLPGSEPPEQHGTSQQLQRSCPGDDPFRPEPSPQPAMPRAGGMWDAGPAPRGSRLWPLAAAQEPPSTRAGTRRASAAPAGLGHVLRCHQPRRFMAGNPALAAASSLNDLPLKYLHSYINTRIARLRGARHPGRLRAPHSRGATGPEASAGCF